MRPSDRSYTKFTPLGRAVTDMARGDSDWEVISYFPGRGAIIINVNGNRMTIFKDGKARLGECLV